MKNNNKITNMVAIDYYDGITQGLVRHNESDCWYYCNMIAWRIQERCRVFCLFPLTDKLRADLEVLINKAPKPEIAYQVWEKKVEEKIDQIYKEATDTVMIVMAEDITDSWISTKIIDKPQLAKVYKRELDDIALQSKKKTEFWFNKFE